MGDKAKPHDVSLQYIFELGNTLERPVIRWLEDAGYEVSQQQRDFAYADKGEPLVTGHIDCILERDGQRWVTDIKTTSPFVWQKLRTNIVSKYPFEEFSIGSWMGKYPAQLQLYMFGLEIPQGLVRLAQIRKTQVEQFTLIIGNTMALRPGTDLQAQLTNTCGDLARLKIDPKVIAGVMDPGLGR